MVTRRAFPDRRSVRESFYDAETLRRMYGTMSVRQICEQAERDGHGHASYGFVRIRLIAAGIELRSRGGARQHTRKFGARA